MSILNIIKGIEPVKIIDIGAMFTGESCVYQKLIEKRMAHVIGFEPNKDECEKLNEMYRDSNKMVKYFPYAIGDGSRRMFYITNTGMTSSLLRPDINLMDKFNNLANLCQVVDCELSNTKRLDDIEEVKGTDYFKIDIQGAEKEVFENASNLLKDVVVIHTEVEFVPLYKDQPLFADVDNILRKNGFQFHKFAGISGRAFKPLIAENDVNRPISQLLWADAVYVKDFMALEELTHEKLLKLAVILHEIYGSVDLCHYVLTKYDKLTGDNLSGKYRIDILGIK